MNMDSTVLKLSLKLAECEQNEDAEEALRTMRWALREAYDRGYEDGYAAKEVDRHAATHRAW